MRKEFVVLWCVSVVFGYSASSSASGQTATQDEPPVVQTESGRVRGTAEDGVETFLGIPYAAAPEGPLRWRKAQPRAEWSDVRDATQKAPRCPQVTVPGALDGEEDCLTVNIWKPGHGKASLPVMVFLHGGRHMVGSAYGSGVNIAGNIRNISFEGNRLAKEGEVVVVSLSRQIQRDWTAFAKGESLDAWKPYANGSDPVLHLDTPTALRTDADPPQCDFWDVVELNTH